MEATHIIKPAGMNAVELFCSDAPDGGDIYNVYAKNSLGDTVLGPMLKDRDEAILFWNCMFSKAVKS